MHTHSIVRSIAILAALACLACAPAAHAQVKLDFENLSNPSGVGGATFHGLSVTQNGFTVTDSVTVLGSLSPDAATNSELYTGSVALYNAGNVGTLTTLTQNNGNPFNLNTIDIAKILLQSASPGGATITFTGNKQGGGTVTQQFTHGANNNLETASFGSNFTNLTSVSFAQVASIIQFDNIVVTPTAVPEPSSVALLVGAVVTGAGFVRRRRGKRCVR